MIPLLPARWAAVWASIKPSSSGVPAPLWPFLVGAGGLVLLAVVVVWFRYAWQTPELTTEFMVLTSFVILIGLALLKSHPLIKEDEGGD